MTIREEIKKVLDKDIVVLIQAGKDGAVPFANVEDAVAYVMAQPEGSTVEII